MALIQERFSTAASIYTAFPITFICVCILRANIKSLLDSYYVTCLYIILF